MTLNPERVERKIMLILPGLEISLVAKVEAVIKAASIVLACKPVASALKSVPTVIWKS